MKKIFLLLSICLAMASCFAPAMALELTTGFGQPVQHDTALENIPCVATVCNREDSEYHRNDSALISRTIGGGSGDVFALLEPLQTHKPTNSGLTPTLLVFGGVLARVGKVTAL